MADPKTHKIEKAREKAIETLKYNYAHQVLEDDDFEQRLDRALQAQTVAELAVLIEDCQSVQEDELPEEKSASRHITYNDGYVRESQSFISIFSGHDRKGIWEPARKSTAVSVMGGTKLDFTNAVLPGKLIRINVFCLMGGIDIVVPPHIKVVSNAVAILGGVDDKSSSRVKKDDPVIEINGLCLLGGISIRRSEKDY